MDKNKGSLTIGGPMPPSVNILYYTDKQTGTRHLTQKARTFKLTLQEYLMKGGAKKLAPPPPYSVHYHFRFPDRRKRDLSNHIKLLEDALFQFLGVDDRHVQDFHVFKYIDKEDPGFSMEIRHSGRKL